MASYQINHYIDTPLGRLHIFSDPDETKKALKLIEKTPQILFNAYKNGAYNYGKIIIKEAIECINKQLPPKGGESWKELSESYTSKPYVQDTHFYQTGQYADSIDIHKDNMYYQSGAFYKTRYFVGLPHGVQKTPLSYQRSKSITLLEVANILELGSRDGRIPKRPLWKPLFEAKGGNKRINRFIQNALKKELSKYM